MRTSMILLLVTCMITWMLPLAEAEELATRHVKITRVKGDVFVKLADSDRWIDAKRGMVLNQKDIIKTSKNGRATIVFDEKDSFEASEYDSIDIYGDTEISLSKLLYNRNTDEKTTLLKMNIGKIMANAAKLKGESKFEVQTPTSVVGVRGTEYIVEYKPGS